MFGQRDVDIDRTSMRARFSGVGNRMGSPQGMTRNGIKNICFNGGQFSQLDADLLQPGLGLLGVDIHRKRSQQLLERALVLAEKVRSSGKVMAAAGFVFHLFL